VLLCVMVFDAFLVEFAAVGVHVIDGNNLDLLLAEETTEQTPALRSHPNEAHRDAIAGRRFRAPDVRGKNERRDGGRGGGSFEEGTTVELAGRDHGFSLG